MSENTGPKQAGQFQKGQSGNPSGKPRGARNKATLAAEALLDGQAQALTQKAIDRALEGDGNALRFCLERILPARKDRPIYFDMPALRTASDAASAMSAIIAGVAQGDLTASEASELTALVTGVVKALETHELEQRIALLEKAAGEKEPKR